MYVYIESGDRSIGGGMNDELVIMGWIGRVKHMNYYG